MRCLRAWLLPAPRPNCPNIICPISLGDDQLNSPARSGLGCLIKTRVLNKGARWEGFNLGWAVRGWGGGVPGLFGYCLEAVREPCGGCAGWWYGCRPHMGECVPARQRKRGFECAGSYAAQTAS